MFSSEHTHKIISEGCFGKKHKTLEEQVRCFLILMLKHIKYLKYDEIYHEEELLNKYSTLADDIFNIDIKSRNFEINDNKLKCVTELLKDDSFLYLIENVQKLTFVDAHLIYKISKILIALADSKILPSLKIIRQDIINYIYNHLDFLLKVLAENLNPSNPDYIIIIVGKFFRKLLKIDNFLDKILNVEFFRSIYSLTKNEKFVLAQESFKILFHIVTSAKYNRDIIGKFFNENFQQISAVLTDGINYTGLTKRSPKEECIFDDFYYMKRETLILLEKILKDPLFEKFSNYFTSKAENLKTIMIQLNNKCEKLVFQAVDILYYFFLDCETKSRCIKLIMHANKENFYKFFDKNENLFFHSSQMMEKKSFILYELERLENFLD